MFRKYENRRVLSLLSRNPHQWISYQQLEFFECTDLDAVINEMLIIDLIELKDDQYKLNLDLYQSLILEQYPFLRKIETNIKERVEGFYLLDPKSLLIVTDYDQQRFLDLYLQLNLVEYGFNLLVYQSHEVPTEKIENALEVLNW